MNLEPNPDCPKALRLFAAIEFPPEVKATVAQTLTRLNKGTVFTGAHPTWVKAEGVHITLLFFGWQSQDRVAALQAALRMGVQNQAPFLLQLGKVTLFPDARAPKVISLGIAGQLDKLLALHASLSNRCGNAGFEVETRPFRPHLTLARIKSRKGLAGLADVIRSHADTAKAGFRVGKVTLFQSHLGQGGSTYTVVDSFPLGAVEASESCTAPD